MDLLGRVSKHLVTNFDFPYIFSSLILEHSINCILFHDFPLGAFICFCREFDIGLCYSST